MMRLGARLIVSEKRLKTIIPAKEMIANSDLPLVFDLFPSET
jgi:hypothetical protein